MQMIYNEGNFKWSENGLQVMYIANNIGLKIFQTQSPLEM